MKETLKRVLLATLVLLLTGVMGLADTPNNNPPPGTLNYVEGKVWAEGEEQSPKSVGTTYLQPNQVLDTRSGYAEMLLTPGIFMRIGHNSKVKMISPDLADTQVQLVHGSAIVEVDELFKENNVSVAMDGATTRIEKQGLYDFTVNPAAIKVLDGKAAVFEGDQRVKLTKGREALLAEAQPIVRRKYNKDQVEEDPLYRWSKLRSDYATEANVNEGYALMAEGGWWGPGWYWDPFFWNFAFMPGFGLGWGPFGFPLFSPWTVGFAPYYGYAFAGGHGAFYRYPAVAARGRESLPPLAHQPRAGSAGFRALPRSMAGGRMMAMGGFRGGMMGDFRDGGMRGGFHGGGFAGRR
jgi:hypothetical protein